VLPVKEDFKNGAKWIRKIPKVELHRHLQGSIRTTTIIDIAKRYKVDLPEFTATRLDRFVKHKHPAKNLLEFLKPWTIFSRIIVNPEIASRITYEAIEDAASDNIEYLELRFAPYTMSNNMKIGTRELVGAIIAAIEDAEKHFPIVVKLVLEIARMDPIKYHNYNLQILTVALDYPDFVVGFDLSGDEANFPPSLYTSFFEHVREHGFKITVHAGEAAGSESVKEAIELLCADRIGHGISALNDPSVMQLLRRPPLQNRPIAVEICPTSSFLTKTLSRNKIIPTIIQFLDYGVPVTISSDSPQVCNTTLTDEFQWLFSSKLLSTSQIISLFEIAIEYSFASTQIKNQLHESLKNSIKKLENINSH
jgi:adenosine deaminase